MGTFSIWHWLVVLLVVVLVFGSGKLADIGSNVGKAIRGYQKSMSEGAKENAKTKSDPPNLAAGESASDAQPATSEKAAS